MRQSWRRWLRGPKHGVARGIAVYGSRGSQHDPEQVADLLSRCPELRAWARAGKTFASWREADSSIPPPAQHALMTLEWVTRAENLAIAGPSGTGKSQARAMPTYGTAW